MDVNYYLPGHFYLVFHVTHKMQCFYFLHSSDTCLYLDKKIKNRLASVCVILRGKLWSYNNVTLLNNQTTWSTNTHTDNPQFKVQLLIEVNVCKEIK